MQFKVKLLTLFLALSSLFNAEAIEPYDSINVLPFDSRGWFLIAGEVEQCLEANPTTVIEIGSWLGLSSRFIAERLPQGGKLYCVDTWLGSPGELVHMKDPKYAYLYQQFLSNIIHAGLTEVIVPIRMKSVEAAKALNVQADLIFIDAAHDENSVYEDICAWLPHLKEGGVMCGDDWACEGVRNGVNKAVKKFGLTVYTAPNFWKFAPKARS